jgi:hypothetical protein
VRELTVASLGVTNITDSVISGFTAPEVGEMFVGADSDDGGAWRRVGPTSGVWTADMSAEVPPEYGEGTFTIDKTHMWRLYIGVPDDDGDATIYSTPGSMPGLFAAPQYGQIGAEGSGLSYITISIPDLGYETTAPAERDPHFGVGDIEIEWDALDPESFLWGREVFLDPNDLTPGLTITASDVMYEMTLTVLDFNVEELDTGSGVLSGCINQDETPPRGVFSFAFADGYVAGIEDLLGIGFAEPTDEGWSLPLCTLESMEAGSCEPPTFGFGNVGWAAGLETPHDGEDGRLLPFDLYTIDVWDLAPEITSLEVTPALVPIDPDTSFAEVALDAVFADIEVADSYDVTVDWGDGTSAAEVGYDTLAPGSGGTVHATHNYGQPGVFVVELTVEDALGHSDIALYEYVVVYDPNDGFVTGGGWFESPAGAYAPDPALVGKATFGFVSKYKKGASVPTGNTQFQFTAGDLNFHSTSYQWLVVTGGDYARYKGEGTINGAMAPTGEPFKFMIWAGDDDPDTFRIRIWYEDGEELVIYDNGFDQPLSGGEIVVHSGK